MVIIVTLLEYSSPPYRIHLCFADVLAAPRVDPSILPAHIQKFSLSLLHHQLNEFIVCTMVSWVEKPQEALLQSIRPSPS